MRQSQPKQLLKLLRKPKVRRGMPPHPTQEYVGKYVGDA